MTRLLFCTGLALMVPFFYSCKKELSEGFFEKGMQGKIEKWISEKQLGMGENDRKKVLLLKQNLDFAQQYYEPLSKHERFIIVPIKSSYQPYYREKNESVYLVLTISESGRINRGNVIDFVPNDVKGTKIPKGTFQKLFMHEKLNVDGKFTTFSISGRPAYRLSFSGGELKYIGYLKAGELIAPTTVPQDPITPDQICTDWYWVTTYYYADGHTEQTQEFAFTTCEPSNGGGGQDDIEYMVTTIEPNNASQASISYGQPYIELTTGVMTSNVSWNWQCGKGSTLVLGNLYNWEYRSYETGVLEKASASELWRIKAITHSSIQRIGQTAPSHEYTQELAYAIFNIAADQLTARVNMEYVVYERISGTSQTKSWRVPATTVCKAN